MILIFANGDLEHGSGWLEPIFEEATMTIAADGGSRHLLALGHRPDVVIGDLDSLPPAAEAAWAAAGTRLLRHPEAKDETDLELALLYAREQSGEPVRIIAGLGGRLDQIFANVLLLMHPALRNQDIRFLTAHQELWVAGTTGATGPIEVEIMGKAGDTLSLIPLGGDALISVTAGLHWPLRDETLSFGPARGLSNVLLNDRARVRIRDGYLLLVHTQQGWQR